MKGSVKLVAIVAFFALYVGLLPVIALPLPYEGLDWLSYGAAMYYEQHNIYLPIILKNHP